MNIFHRYVLPYMESNMYVLVDGAEALVIDPGLSDDLISRFNKQGVQRVTVLLTHEHFDHISGMFALRKQFSTVLVCQRECASSIAVAKNNRPLPLLQKLTKENRAEIMEFYQLFSVQPIYADVEFDTEYIFTWKRHRIRMLSMPGHSSGSAIIEFDEYYIFTGDYMIPNVAVILRYPGGSHASYEQCTLPYLLAIEDDKIIMPGHGNSCYRKMMIYQKGIFIIVNE